MRDVDNAADHAAGPRLASHGRVAPASGLSCQAALFLVRRKRARAPRRHTRRSGRGPTHPRRAIDAPGAPASLESSSGTFTTRIHASGHSGVSRTHRPAHCSFRPDAVVSCDVYARLAADDMQFVCVAVDLMPACRARASMSVTQPRQLQRRRPRTFHLAAARPALAAVAIFWRIFGALGDPIWLARAK